VLRIRLRRTGAKKQPRYRVVVAESSAPRDGAFVEVLGWYNPQADPAQVVINTDKAQEWIRRGAQPSDRVAYLLTQASAAQIAEPAAAASVAAPAARPVERPAPEPVAPVEPAGPAELAASEAPESEGSAALAEGGASSEPAEATAADAPEGESGPPQAAGYTPA
jgi:small subunit ribosomal protein S16